MKIFSYDSPFMTWYRLLIDYILLGLLWIVACLPVVTFGAATTAALLTAEISLNKDGGKLFGTFWGYFVKEFKEATVLWFMQLPILMVLAVNIWLLIIGQHSGIMVVLSYVASAVVFCWIQLWFAYLSKFEDSIKTVLGNTFRMMIGNFGRTVFMTLTIAAFIAAAVIALFLLPIVLLLIPGGFLLVYTAIMRKLFAKYIPQEEPCTKESGA